MLRQALPILFLCTSIILLTAPLASAQTSIQAHYAEGQIWVTWEFVPPGPQTFVIYGSDTPITQFAGSEQTGRLFQYEYLPGALREQFGLSDLGWTIPTAGGAAIDTLSGSQGLFVETVHAAGPRYFAIVAFGDTTITPGVNATTLPAQGLYEPSEKVESHLQFEAPTLDGFTSRVFAMWADGREDPEDHRPDFPVCANAAKNGMPSIFIVSARDDIEPGPQPVTYWLHGGGGRAKQSMPGVRPYYNIDPDEGLLVAHNDDMVRWFNATIQEEASSTWWFGWGIHHDPFPEGPTFPPADEIIVNYTQRRLVWIHEWLVRKGWVDAEYTSLIGHSMGSAGTTALGKAYPDKIATCTIMNNGFAGPDALASIWNILGWPEDDLKCNLVDAGGDSIPVYKVFDLSTSLAPGKDLPLFRSFHGKNDTSDTMMWDAFVTDQYRLADSLGMGMQLYWDERTHTPPGYWANGYTSDLQSERDNVAYQETFGVHQSFPAFYGHRLFPGIPAPGDGDPASGDPRGTWGGYHDWNRDTLVDEPERWEATIFLISGSPWLPDNTPVDSLLSKFTIRRAQSFAPAAGEIVDWCQLSSVGDTLRSGETVADAGGRVHIESLTTYRDPYRSRVQFARRSSEVGDEEAPETIFSLEAAPNPFNPKTEIRFNLDQNSSVNLYVFDLGGRRVRTLHTGIVLDAGEHLIEWKGQNDRGETVASGVYFLSLSTANQSLSRKLVLLK